MLPKTMFPIVSRKKLSGAPMNLERGERNARHPFPYGTAVEKDCSPVFNSVAPLHDRTSMQWTDRFVNSWANT